MGQLTKSALATRRWRAKQRAKGFAVYYLPEHHYVGMTDLVKDRMMNHSREGKIVDGYEVLAYFERAVDAAWFETMLHQRGYNGSRWTDKNLMI